MCYLVSFKNVPEVNYQRGVEEDEEETGASAGERVTFLGQLVCSLFGKHSRRHE
jgi:hypothetical protein